jgi:hypothetical protein
MSVATNLANILEFKIIKFRCTKMYCISFALACCVPVRARCCDRRHMCFPLSVELLQDRNPAQNGHIGVTQHTMDYILGSCLLGPIVHMLENDVLLHVADEYARRSGVCVGLLFTAFTC